MKHTLLAFLAMLPLTLFAKDCYQNLSNDFQDSHTHRINVSSYSDSDKLKTMSYVALRVLYSEFKCGSMKNIYLKCNQAIKGISNTEICYGEGEYGYFLISKDYLNNLNVIFNRWD